ncbi:indole-3-glycerol phosphate synthase TrpC [Luteibacter sp.]|jgi:indole-3-glycerol phosphate synthase|uniref:indole-3-glycerol phosphate synthase TrpC n=1 Tax=Luteibacter sp. TaxID=1886636 RepID=UPI002F3E73A6
MSDILQRILARKKEEIRDRTQAVSLAQLTARGADQAPTRGFATAIRAQIASGKPAVIAELKKASPSKGLIREHFDPIQIARSYEAAGATCLSVLTDASFFQGHEDYLRQAHDACSLPILRKDFIVDVYQVYEARAIGADCILLIVAAFADGAGGYDVGRMTELAQCAKALTLDVLVEVHDAAELDAASALPVTMIGVNNRDLRTFETSLDTSLALMGAIGADTTMISESGIHTVEDVRRLRDAGIHGFLVGEAFMRAPDPGHALRQLFFAPPAS